MSFTALRPEDYFAAEAEGRQPVVITRPLPTVGDVRWLLPTEVSLRAAEAAIIAAIDMSARRYGDVQYVSKWTEIVAMRAAATLTGNDAEVTKLEREIPPPWNVL